MVITILAHIAFPAITLAASSPSTTPPVKAGQSQVPQAPTSYVSEQLGFDDDTLQVSSIFLSGYNQNGQFVANFSQTPYPFTHVYNWWWETGTQVNITGYSSSDCSGSPNRTGLYAVTGGSSQWHCELDVSPFTDWDC